MSRDTVNPALHPGDVVRVLVTGSRTWSDLTTVYQALTALHAGYGRYLVVVHGACPSGADAIADRWARRHGVPVEAYPANWHRYGRRAGPVRNAAMVATAPARCLAFIAHNSAGASHCAALAVRAGIPTTTYRTGGQL